MSPKLCLRNSGCERLSFGVGTAHYGQSASLVKWRNWLQAPRRRTGRARSTGSSKVMQTAAAGPNSPGYFPSCSCPSCLSDEARPPRLKNTSTVSPPGPQSRKGSIGSNWRTNS